jgi:hypothetical protein
MAFPCDGQSLASLKLPEPNGLGLLVFQPGQFSAELLSSTGTLISTGLCMRSNYVAGTMTKCNSHAVSSRV